MYFGGVPVPRFKYTFSAFCKGRVSDPDPDPDPQDPHVFGLPGSGSGSGSGQKGKEMNE